MATTGAKFPTAGASASEAPWSDDDWTNPGNILSDNATNASVTAATFDTGDQTTVLKATGFDFSAIPDGSVIDGVICVINGYYANGTASFDLIQLLDSSGNKTGTNQASTPVVMSTTTSTTVTKGSSTDLWGNSLTASWVKSANFGVAIGCLATGANSDVFVDYVTLEVYYTPASALTSSASLDAAVVASVSATAFINTAVQSEQTLGASLDLYVEESPAGGFISPALMAASGLGAVGPASITQSASVDTAVQSEQTKTAQLNAAVQSTGTVGASFDASIFGGASISAGLDVMVQSGATASASVDTAVQASQTASASLSTYVDIQAGFFSPALMSVGGIGAAPLPQSLSASLSTAVQVSGSASASLDLMIDPGGDPVGAFLSPALMSAGGLGGIPPAPSQPVVFDNGIPGAWYPDPGFAALYAFQPVGVPVANRSAVAFSATLSGSADVAVQVSGSASASLGLAVEEAKTATASLGAFVQSDAAQVAQFDAAIQAPNLATSEISTAVQLALSQSASVGTAVQAARTIAASLGVYIADVLAVSASLGAAVQAERSGTASLGAGIQDSRSMSLTLGAYVLDGHSVSARLSVYIASGSTTLARGRSGGGGGGRRIAPTTRTRFNSGGNRR